ncbi:MAG: orotate phosphoribosyltransferase, partial [Myxococcales bacterium]|nr:orotate phosphoribosyltransferase [Myxococcales bacterium]
MKQLIRRDAYREGAFTLASGRPSTYLVDVKRVALQPEGAWLLGSAMAEVIRNQWPSARGAGGRTLGADPLATAIAIASHQSPQPLEAFIVRKEPKDHGSGVMIERSAQLRDGDPVVIIEDVATTGGSALKAVEAARREG